MVKEQPDNWNGISLITPYLALRPDDQADIEKLLPYAKFMNRFLPNYKFNLRNMTKDKSERQEAYRNFAEDPKYEGMHIAVSTVL